jgi:hypothetical protein
VKRGNEIKVRIGKRDQGEDGKKGKFTGLDKLGS